MFSHIFYFSNYSNGFNPPLIPTGKIPKLNNLLWLKSPQSNNKKK